MSVKDTRLSQILPVIRCSDCGHDVQFRMLGEHICSSAPPLPTAPVPPLARKSISGVSSGGYKPGHRPPPIPIAAPLAISKHNNYPGEPPLTPGRPSTSSQRPSLPFLEKYAKKNKSTSSITPPTPTSATHPEYCHGSRSNNGYGITLSSAPILLSPTTPTTPGLYGQTGQGNGHYAREQRDYFPRTPTDDRFSSQPNQSHQPYRRHTPTSRTPEMPRPKTPVLATRSFSSGPTSPRISHHPQPALPQKSNARSPSIASAHGLNLLVDIPAKMKPLPRIPLEDEYNCVNSSSMDYTSPASPPPPSVSSKFSRSGSSGSVASSIMGESRPSGNYNRERSKTMPERSELSSRSVQSERIQVDDSQRGSGDGSLMRRERERESRNQLAPSSRSERPRGQDATTAYKTPSPPLSPGELRSEPIKSPRPQYRPPTPPEASPPTSTRGRRPSLAPSRKPSMDQFDALMEDLMQEISTLPTGTNFARHSTRSVSSSAGRSRSRPNLPEFGPRDRDFTASSTSTPPPTPGLPNIASGTESLREPRSSIRESRSASERAYARERSRTLEERPSERERDKERIRDREVRELVRERERERGRADDKEPNRDHPQRTTERESRPDRERARDRDRDRASTRSSIRSRSLNARTGVTHCEGCKHDIRPHDLDIVKIAHGDYHLECFKCGRCHRPIESARKAQYLGGRLLCERDYTRLKEKETQKAAPSSSATPAASSPPSSRRPICAGCEGAIHSPNPVVYALGKSWHEHHLSCDHCHKPIQVTVGHVEKNGRVYCHEDYDELFLPKCRACGLVVEKEAVCAQDGKLEGKWHATCFGCQLCKKPFPDKSFYVLGNAPYCRRHYHKMNNSLCKGCDHPIEGPCAQTTEGWRFHPNCFSCVECRTPLTDVYYNYENKAYCERHIMIIQRTRQNVRAERRRTFVGRI